MYKAHVYPICIQFVSNHNSSVFVPRDGEEMFTSELYYCTVDLSHLRIRIIFIISDETSGSESTKLDDSSYKYECAFPIV